MNISFKQGKVDAHKSRVLVVGCFEDILDNLIKSLDSRLDGIIVSSIEDKNFTGKKNQIKIITPQNKIAAAYLVVVGIGKKDRLDLETLRQASGSACKAVRQLRAKEFTTALINHVPSGFNITEVTQAVVEGACLSLYSFNEYKTENIKEFVNVNKITLISNKKLDTRNINKGIDLGKKISEAVYFTRDLVSRPGNSATPTFLSNAAQKMAKKYKIKCNILGLEHIKRLKMGAFLGVCRGSNEPPKLIILEYWGRNRKESPIVLIGKGVTFDSGGISLKPSKGMEEMKHDMSGGAAVMGAIKVCASLKLPVNVVSIIPATENLPDGSASKPGDILKSMSGKTIEVISTDAEGRLILADALTYAERYRPKAVIDLATLTGACITALGRITTGILGNDERIISSIKKAGNSCGERVWELPLWEEYSELLKSPIADMKNVGNGTAGTITGAAFLQKFAHRFKWAHLDIAGTAWTDKALPYIPKGATGVGVRILVTYLSGQNFKSS